VAEHLQRKPPTRAQLVRDHLVLEIRPVRSLLSALVVLPWQAAPDHPVLAALQLLKASYEHSVRELPAATAIDFGRVWRALLSGADREQAFRAFEVATLLALRRALRNGTVWIDHSLAFRSRERLFIPAERWQKERNSYYRRLSLPKRAESYLEPLIERAQAGVAAVAKAVEAGDLRVDDELHLTPLAAEEEEPELVKLRAALDHRIGEAQLPELLLEVLCNPTNGDGGYRQIEHSGLLANFDAANRHTPKPNHPQEQVSSAWSAAGRRPGQRRCRSGVTSTPTARALYSSDNWYVRTRSSRSKRDCVGMGVGEAGNETHSQVPTHCYR
jgi:hypothetical protein